MLGTGLTGSLPLEVLKELTGARSTRNSASVLEALNVQTDFVANTGDLVLASKLPPSCEPLYSTNKSSKS
jgi:hypothetical protein